MRPDVGVIVVAAGRGERAGGGVPKQFRLVAGMPLVTRAAAPFLAHASVAQVVIVLPPEFVADPPELLLPLTRHAKVIFASGGAQRADSVRAGLRVLSPDCDLVLVHDAARPFADEAVIDRVVTAVRAGSSAIPALPVGDTLKRAGGDPPVVHATMPRDGLWGAQTPQGFPRAVLERAHSAAAAHPGTPTDDAALVEQLGEAVRLVAGSPFNIKVTAADDFTMAELIATARTS